MKNIIVIKWNEGIKNEHSLFFANRTLALKETTNSIKHHKKNKNYNEILEKAFIFNLQTMLTARRRCRSSLSCLALLVADIIVIKWNEGIKNEHIVLTSVGTK
jgi:hypothetical protein